jgi:hypothetical protein
MTNNTSQVQPQRGGTTLSLGRRAWLSLLGNESRFVGLGRRQFCPNPRSLHLDHKQLLLCERPLLKIRRRRIDEGGQKRLPTANAGKRHSDSKLLAIAIVLALALPHFCTMHSALPGATFFFHSRNLDSILYTTSKYDPPPTSQLALRPEQSDALAKHVLRPFL